MEYRLKVKYWRDDDTAEIKHYYYIEYLSKYFGWIKYTIRICCFGDCYKSIKTFYKKGEAIEYINNLQKEIPEDKIIKIRN